MNEGPLGLVDRSPEHNDIVDVLLGARQLLERFAALAAAPDADAHSEEPDARIVVLCLGVCALRARLLRWLALVEAPPAAAAERQGFDSGLRETLLR